LERLGRFGGNSVWQVWDTETGGSVSASRKRERATERSESKAGPAATCDWPLAIGQSREKRLKLGTRGFPGLGTHTIRSNADFTNRSIASILNIHHRHHVARQWREVELPVHRKYILGPMRELPKANAAAPASSPQHQCRWYVFSAVPSSIATGRVDQSINIGV
jgi:hypothetical protein